MTAIRISRAQTADISLNAALGYVNERAQVERNFAFDADAR